MNIEAIAFTERGGQLACRLRDALEGAGTSSEGDLDASGRTGTSIHVSVPERYAEKLGVDAYESLDAWTRDAFAASDALLFVSATGIAVRAIAPYVRDKFSDPAVVSIDEGGSFVVPLLSGHVGGANDFAREVATACGAQAVVSTATDVNGLFAVDEWARKQNLAILDRTAAKEVSAAVLAGTPVGFASDFAWKGELPQGFAAIECGPNAQSAQSSNGPEPAGTPHLARAASSNAPKAGTSRDETIPELGVSVSFDPDKRPFATTLRLVPQIVSIGVGCKRDTPVEKIAELVDACLENAHIAPHAVCTLASIDVKSDEAGLLGFATKRNWPTRFYSAKELAAVPGEFSASSFVAKTVGVDNVCERAACAAAGPDAILIQPRRSHDGVTVALAAGKPKLFFR